MCLPLRSVNLPDLEGEHAGLSLQILIGACVLQTGSIINDESETHASFAL